MVFPFILPYRDIYFFKNTYSKFQNDFQNFHEDTELISQFPVSYLLIRSEKDGIVINQAAAADYSSSLFCLLLCRTKI